jgi:hypothetical protein
MTALGTSTRISAIGRKIYNKDFKSRDIAQAVSRRLPSTAARVRARVR